jgi:hypothetical protein
VLNRREFCKAAALPLLTPFVPATILASETPPQPKPSAEDFMPIDQWLQESLPYTYDKPTPIQRFIVKLLYRLPLEPYMSGRTGQDIEIENPTMDGSIAGFSEQRFLKCLYNSGRTNIDPARYIPNQIPFRTILLRFGRRSGKSILMSWLSRYTINKLDWLMERYSPVVPTRDIFINCVGTGSQQARCLLNVMKWSFPHPKFNWEDEKRIPHRLIMRHKLSNVRLHMRAIAGDRKRAIGGGPAVLSVLENYACYENDPRPCLKSTEGAVMCGPIKVQPMTVYTGTPNGYAPTDEKMRRLENDIRDGTIPNGLVLHLPTLWLTPFKTTRKMVYDWRKNQPELEWRAEFEAEYVTPAP